MLKKLTRFAAILLLIGGVVATAAAQKTVTLRLSTPTATDHPYTQGAQKFADLVSQYTNGTVEVKIFPNNQLGSPTAVAQGLQLGTIDMGIVASSHLTSYDNLLSALDLPFLFKNRQDAYAKLDSPLGQQLAKPLEKKNMLLLTYFDGGFRDLFDKKGPIKSPADIKSMKLRMRVINSPVYIAFAKAIGASPAPLPWSELYTDLQQGVVDAAETGIAQIEAQKFYEVAKYVSLDQHTFTASPLIISLRKYNQLSASQQDAVQKAAKQAADFERTKMQAAVQAGMETLKNQGVIFTQVDKAAFKEAVKPVWAQFEKELGSDLINKLSQ